MQFDFRQTVIDSFDQMVESGKLREFVADAVAKTTKSIIETETREYSEFGKKIAEGVRNALALHGNVDLPSYNQTIVNLVRLQVQSYAETSIQKQVAKALEELLVPAPAEIKLSVLVEQYRDYLRKQLPDEDYDEHRMTVHIENDERLTRLAQGLFGRGREPATDSLRYSALCHERRRYLQPDLREPDRREGAVRGSVLPF
jgi:hypothetical protein